MHYFTADVAAQNHASHNLHIAVFWLLFEITLMTGSTNDTLNQFSKLVPQSYSASFPLP